MNEQAFGLIAVLAPSLDRVRSKALTLPRGWPEAALAAAVAVALTATELLTAYYQGAPLGLNSFALLLAGAAALLLIRRVPLLAAVVLGGTLPPYYVLGDVDNGFGWLPYVIGVFWLAAERHRPAAITATAVAFAMFAFAEAMAQTPLRAAGVFSMLCLVLTIGEIARNRRAYLREVEQRVVEAERTREEEARRRATEERLRIARELHDVLAHQVSLINVQAGAAAHRRDPQQAFTALAAIKAASKETLSELRSILGVLRQVDADAESGPAAPAPSLERLPDLTAQTAEAGLPVELTVEGDTAGLPAAVDLAAYRIAQEALTNAVRHSGAESAAVTLRYTEDGVEVRIEDNGRGLDGPAAPEGNGLRGMAERASAVGGSFSVEPRPGGGTRVTAVLPLHGVDA